MQAADLMFRPGLLGGHRILVSGGGTGLGKVMAEAFLLLGAEVFICGRRLSVLEEAAAELAAAHGGVVHPIACDIRSAEAVDAMLDAIWAQGGPLTGLVNNAAGNFLSRSEDLSPNGFDAISGIVFRGGFLMTQGCGKRWIRDGVAGSVVSVLAAWIEGGVPYTLPSAMSKAGIDMMTRTLALEWGRQGIRLNAVAPGAFPTEGVQAHLRPGAAPMRPGAPNDLNPVGRNGRMAELANLVVFLMAPGSEYVTGETIMIDGGDHLLQTPGSEDRRGWTDEQWRAERESVRSHDRAQREHRTVTSG